MSKLSYLILPIIPAILLILQLFNNSFGQDIAVTVTIDTSQATTVTGKFRNPDDIANRRNLPFLKEYAGIDKLGERLSGARLTDGDGQDVEFRQLIPGEFLARGPFVNWNYKIDLTPRKNPSASAHVSWIKDDLGILFLDDLLPQLSVKNSHPTAKVSFELPKGWQIYSTEKKASEFAFESVNIERAVFLVGKGIRQIDVAVNGVRIRLAIAGSWQFSDAEAAQMIGEIYAENRKLFRADPGGDIQVCLIKFPQTVPPGMWEADTRGPSVTIVSSDMPFKSQSLQRLHEQLRHEIFHLWVPNALNLTGNYDWFYEGFALYHSLKSGVFSNRIRFDDFLDTLSRAYNIDAFQNPRLPLIEASQQRWSGANTQIYSRGMLAAFLCDLALLKRSKGKTSIDDVLKDIYLKYSGPIPVADGNTAILKELASHPELQPIIDKYISGGSPVDWSGYLADAGLEAKEQNLVTVLTVMARPNGRQKDLLDRLGYNNWRKLSKSSK